MAYSNYSQIEEAIASTTPFKGNSAQGYWENGTYWVQSYSTVIGANNPTTGVKNVNTNHYSKTTTRLQRIIVRAWNLS